MDWLSVYVCAMCVRVCAGEQWVYRAQKPISIKNLIKHKKFT